MSHSAKVARSASPLLAAVRGEGKFLVAETRFDSNRDLEFGRIGVVNPAVDILWDINYV